jgi:hypothetical protein
MIGRLLGMAGVPKPAEIDKRARAAAEAFLRLYANPTADVRRRGAALRFGRDRTLNRGPGLGAWPRDTHERLKRYFLAEFILGLAQSETRGLAGAVSREAR